MSQASSNEFILALKQSVSAVLDSTVDGSIALVTDVSVTANRRMLLSGVSVSYTVTVSSGRTPDYYVTSLQSSLGSNTFVATLSSNSGVPIAGTSGVVISNTSPTISPTKSPQSSTSANALNAIGEYEAVHQSANCYAQCVSSKQFSTIFNFFYNK